MTKGMFSDSVVLANALDSVERLSLKDQEVDPTAQGYQPGDVFSYLKDQGDTYSNLLYSSSFEVDPYYEARY